MAAATLGFGGGLENAARADVEGRLPLARIQLDSPGLDDSGPVHIGLSQDENGIAELRVTAFGKIRTVTNAQLDTIGNSVFNVIGVSYSRGYTNAGGRNVYVLLYQAFSSGVQVSAVVTVPERGDVRVDKANGNSN